MEKKDLSRIRLWLFDMDGTLYLGEQLFSFTKELLGAIRGSGGHYLFLTNNSSKSVDKYVEKMERIGIHAVPEEFFTSTDASCVYLREHYHLAYDESRYLITYEAFASNMIPDIWVTERGAVLHEQDD